MENVKNHCYVGDEKKLPRLPIKKGPDGRPLLFGPKIEQCQTRKLV